MSAEQVPPPSAALAQLAFLAELSGTAPAGPYSAHAQPDGSWQVRCGPSSDRVLAEGLSQAEAEGLAAVVHHYPSMLARWADAVHVAKVLAELALAAGADPERVAEALRLLVPPDSSGLERQLAELGGVRDDEAAVNEALRRLLGDDPDAVPHG